MVNDGVETEPEEIKISSKEELQSELDETIKEIKTIEEKFINKKPMKSGIPYKPKISKVVVKKGESNLFSINKNIVGFEVNWRNQSGAKLVVSGENEGKDQESYTEILGEDEIILRVSRENIKK